MTDLYRHQSGLRKAIRHFGSQALLSKLLGISPRVVSHWLNQSQKIPYQYAVQIYHHTRGKISLHELAPDQLLANHILETQLILREPL